MTRLPVEIPHEMEALVALYHATNGAGWIDNSGWLTDAPVGEWHGVQVDFRGRVIGLDLSSNKMRGEIPIELGNLVKLEYADLSNNELCGEIPPEISNLISLEGLWLNRNKLSGEIPPDIGNLFYLISLEIDTNILTGKIPPELGNLSDLSKS